MFLNKSLIKRVALVATLFSCVAQASNEFPQPDCLNNNVAFWEDVYTEYAEDDGVIHNTETFEIYSVVKLPPRTKSKLRAKAVDAALMAVRQAHKEVSEKHIRLQNGVKERFNQGVIRSYEFVPSVVKELQEHDLPIELALLPHVESSYNPKAKSKVGATGLWQIMRSTAKMFGFKKKKDIEDPYKSTEIAANILKHKYKKAQTWPIALTAYNHGIGGMLRAIEQTKSTDICVIIDKYDGKSFGFASKNFYAQFLAVKNILSPIYANKVKGWKNDHNTMESK